MYSTAPKCKELLGYIQDHPNVSQQELLDVFSWGRDTIKECLSILEESAVRMEIKTIGKSVPPKRDCFYTSLIEKKRERGRPRYKHAPPFRDRAGNVYQSREEVMQALGIDSKMLCNKLARGVIGSCGNPAVEKKSRGKGEGTREPYIHNPPYTDLAGNVYHSREEVITAHNISMQELTRALTRGAIGSCGNFPQAISRTQEEAPYLDNNGNSFDSAEDVMSHYSITYSTFKKWRTRGIIGINGNLPTASYKRRGYKGKKPPFVDAEGNIYNSRESAIAALGVTSHYFSVLLYRGHIGCEGNPPTSALTRKYRKPPYRDYEGNWYYSRKELSDALGLAYRTINTYLINGRIGHSGQLPEKPVKPKCKKVTNGVKTWEKISECASEFGVSYQTIQNWCQRKSNWKLIF